MARPKVPDASGRFVLRLEPGLHAALRRAAAAHGLSLNDYCATKLAAPVGNLFAFGAAPQAVRRAAVVAGEALAGCAAFGSWARGELADDSDVDVLVAVDPGLRVTRALYRRWDEAPVTWNGRRVEPHFVHLPAQNRPPSGLWAELAIDGIVLFERDLALSSYLAAVRRALAQGRLRHEIVHGVRYWTAAG